MKKIIVLLIVLFIQLLQQNTAFAYGANKKKGVGSIYHASILRATDNGGGLRSDTELKYGINDKIAVSAQLSMIAGAINSKGFYGANYLQANIFYQLLRTDKYAWNIGGGLRSPSKITNDEYEHGFLSTGRDLKYIFYTGFDYNFTKNHQLKTQFMYRQHEGYSKFRFNVDYWWFINNDWSLQIFWWETFDTRSIDKSSALIEIAPRYKITKDISVGVGVSYYWMPHIKYNWKNHSVILLFSYDFSAK